MTKTFEASGSNTFNASGITSIELTPYRYGVIWIVKRMIVTTTSTSQTEVRTYKNSESPSSLVDNSAVGNSDSSETNITLRGSDRLLFVWSNGTVGSRATVNIFGEQEGQ